MKKTVIITGSHRSGTTWLGRVLSSPPNVEYVAEPFNPSFNHYKNPIKFWFQYFDEKTINDEQLKYLVANFSFGIKNLRFKVLDALSKKWWGPSMRMILRQHQIDTKIVKDPISVFSSPYLAEKFNSKVIVTLRHPCAFAASISVKGWKFDFKQMLEQPELMNRISQYESEIKHMLENSEATCVEQAALIWNIIHDYLHEYVDSEYFYFVKNENLSLNPISEIEKICKYIELPFDDNIRSKINETTSGGSNSNTVTNSKNDSIVRDSKQHVEQWKTRLSKSEIHYILDQTEKVRAKYEY